MFEKSYQNIQLKEEGDAIHFIHKAPQETGDLSCSARLKDLFFSQFEKPGSSVSSAAKASTKGENSGRYSLHPQKDKRNTGKFINT